MTQPGGPIWTGRPDVEKIDRAITATIADGPFGGGGTLTIDPDRVEECVAGLWRAVDKVNEAIDLGAYMVFPPPGNDPVSVNLAEQAAIMRDRAIAFAATWRQQILDTIHNLEEQLAAYRATEDENRIRFT